MINKIQSSVIARSANIVTLMYCTVDYSIVNVTDSKRSLECSDVCFLNIIYHLDATNCSFQNNYHGEQFSNRTIVCHFVYLFYFLIKATTIGNNLTVQQIREVYSIQKTFAEMCGDKFVTSVLSQKIILS